MLGTNCKALEINIEESALEPVSRGHLPVYLFASWFSFSMCRTMPCLQHSQDMLSEELTLSVCRRTWWCVGENFCASLCLLTSCELVVFSFLNMYICTVIDYSFSSSAWAVCKIIAWHTIIWESQAATFLSLYHIVPTYRYVTLLLMEMYVLPST